MIINFNKCCFCKKYISRINEAYNVALDILKIKCRDLEINIDFVSKKQIRFLNKKYRNTDKATDVLSFPNLLIPKKEGMQLITNNLDKKNYIMEINPENNCIFIGDISICKNIVFKHAKEYGNTKIREMTYMAVHGLLHLLGYDHIIEDDKKIMRKMEEKIMKKINLERK